MPERLMTFAGSVAEVRITCLAPVSYTHLDLYVLVGDHAIQLHVGLHHGVLHQDTVADHCALLDLDAAKEHTVLHGALNEAAVGQDGVFHLGAGDITGCLLYTSRCV